MRFSTIRREKRRWNEKDRGGRARFDAEYVQHRASRPRRKSEERHKSEGGSLSRTSTTQLKHHLHRHGQTEHFRCRPLHRHRARRYYRSVLPFSVFLRRRRLIHGIGKRAPRDSDHIVARQDLVDVGVVLDVDGVVGGLLDILKRAPRDSDHIIARQGDSLIDIGLEIDGLGDIDVEI